MKKHLAVFLVIFAFVTGGFVFSVARSSERTTKKFPEGFRWCVATSAHQIEGNNSDSDWWAWEKIPGHIKNGEESGLATNHWELFPRDIELMKQLGVTQYRFSIEWAKIEPRPGEWNVAALEHYKREIIMLRRNGIEPFVTLHHFTLPEWFAKRGGWSRAGAASDFAKYVEFISKNLGMYVKDWVTFNEPMVHLGGGYVLGITPPQKHDLKYLERPLLELLHAHVNAYRILHADAKRQQRLIRVGFAHHLRGFEPYNPVSPFDQILSYVLDQLFNWTIPNALETGTVHAYIPMLLNIDTEIHGLKGSQDFFGINYYTRDLVEFHVERGQLSPIMHYNEKAPRSDLEWEIYPQGFKKFLVEIHERYPRLPVFITENGIADANDRYREYFLKSHLEVVLDAISEGVPIKNYCYWSLLDNFEWIEGFTPRFGLYEVDYSNFRRTARKSAEFFSKTAHENELSE